MILEEAYENIIRKRRKRQWYTVANTAFHKVELIQVFQTFSAHWLDLVATLTLYTRENDENSSNAVLF